MAIAFKFTGIKAEKIRFRRGEEGKIIAEKLEKISDETDKHISNFSERLQKGKELNNYYEQPFRKQKI